MHAEDKDKPDNTPGHATLEENKDKHEDMHAEDKDKHADYKKAEKENIPRRTVARPLKEKVTKDQAMSRLCQLFEGISPHVAMYCLLLTLFV